MKKIIKREDVALIIPIIKQKNIIILEQYRSSLNTNILEFPGGKRIKEEPITDTAYRELKEETGFSADHLSLIGSFYTAPHFTNERIFVFLADITDNYNNKQELENEEIINLKYISYKDLFELYFSQQILDAKTQIAISYLIKHST